MSCLLERRLAISPVVVSRGWPSTYIVAYHLCGMLTIISSRYFLPRPTELRLSFMSWAYVDG